MNRGLEESEEVIQGKEFYLSWYPNREIEAICSESEYIKNNACDKEDEQMG